MRRTAIHVNAASRDAASPAKPGFAEAPGPRLHGETPRAHVLVIDDDAIERDAVTDLLRTNGFSISTASDGEAALAEAIRVPPDLVIMDLTMPRVGGLDLCRRLREVNPDLPVIIVTKQSDTSSVIASWRTRVDDYLGKPLDGNELLYRIERTMERRHLEVELARLAEETSAINERLVLSSLREQENAEAAELQRAQFSALLENLSEGVVIADGSGRIMMANRAAHEMWLGEQVVDDVRELNRLEALHVDGTPCPVDERPLTRALRGEKFERCEQLFVRADGEVRQLLATGTNVRGAEGNVELAIVVFRDVTERRQTGEALRASEERHRALFLHGLTGMVLARPTGEIMTANPAACRMLGRTEPEMCLGAGAGILDPTDPRVPEFVAERKRNGFVRGELTFVRKDGTKFPAEVSSAIFPDAQGRELASMSFTDLTERKRTENVLRILGDVATAPLALGATIDRITALVVPRFADTCIVDLVEGGFLRRAAATSGDPRREVPVAASREMSEIHTVDAGVGKVLRTGEPEFVPVVTDEYLRAASFADEHDQPARASAPTSLIVVPLRVQQEVIGAMTLALEAGERRFDERDVALAESLADRAAIAVEHAQIHEATVAAKRLRDEVLGVVSHDLRNPLNSIGLMAQVLLRRSPRDPELLAIRQVVALSDRLIQDLLTTAKVDSGDLPIDRRAEGVRGILDDVVVVYRPIAEAKSLVLDVSFEQERPDAYVDRHRVVQLLSNLVSNAIKFTPPGGRASLQARCSLDALRLTVHDDGAGIAKEDIPHIFDRFWQGTHAYREGAGLGLAIVKGIVDAHGGEIRVESEVGKGTTFTVTLPAKPPAAG